MRDIFQSVKQTLDSPAFRAFAITPSNTVLFTIAVRAIYVGVTGDVKALLVGDTAAVVFKAVPAGSILPIRAQRIDATGTTATDLVGMY